MAYSDKKHPRALIRKPADEEEASELRSEANSQEWIFDEKAMRATPWQTRRSPGVSNAQ